MAGPRLGCVMATDSAVPAPNPVQLRDARVVIGIPAIFEGAIWNSSLDDEIAGS
jgi:hypothetical protein